VSSNHIAISLQINAPIQEVWDLLTQWEKQGEWMLQTKVWVTSEITEGIGTSIQAFTGVGSLGVLDSMTITSWQPPHTCDVVHTGRVIKGTGRFHLREITSDTTVFDWSEEVIAPRLFFVFIFPALYLGVRISLSRFARTFRR